MEGTGTRWLVSLCCLLTAAQCVPSRVTSRLETDSEDSRRVLGSSVVTSVSVIMDHGNGTKTYFADGQSKHVQQQQQHNKPTAAIIGSPGSLMSPDRYEFYTFDETGDLVKRLMTLDEIHGLIAGADPESVMADASPTYYHDALSSHSSEALMHLPATDLESLDAPAVHKVLESVQNVLKNEMAANSGRPAPPPHRPAAAAAGGGPSSPLHRPDSAAAWQALFPGLIETPDDVAHLSGYLLPSKTTESSADAPLTKKPTSPTPVKARPPSTTAKSPASSSSSPSSSPSSSSSSSPSSSSSSSPSSSSSSSPSSSSSSSPSSSSSSSSSLSSTTSSAKTQPPSTTTEKVRSTPKYSVTTAGSESTNKYDPSQQSTTLKPQVTKKPFKPTQTFEKQKPSLQKPTAVFLRPTAKPSPMAADGLDINKEMSASISDMLSQVTDSQSSNHKPLQTNALVEKDNTADYVPEESSPELSYYSPMAMSLSTAGGLKPVTEALTSAKRPPTTSSLFKATSTETPFSQKTSPNIITSTRFGPTKYNATKLRPPANVTASYMTKPLPINKFNGMNSTTVSTTRNNYQYPPSNMSTKYMQKITQTTQAYPNKLIDSFVKVVNKTMMNNATTPPSTFKQSTESSTVKQPTETTSSWNTTTAAEETKNKFTKEPNKVFQTKVTSARPNAVNRTNVTLSNRIQEPQKTTAIPNFSPSTTTVRSHTVEPEKFVSVKVEGWPLTSQRPTTTAPPPTAPYAQTTEKSFFSSSNQPLNSFTDANTIRELISSLMVKSTTTSSVPTSTVSAAPTASSVAQETLTAAASTTSPTPVKTVTGVPASLLSSTEVPSTSTLTTTTSTAAPSTTTAETTTTTAATTVGSAAVKTAAEEATTATTTTTTAPSPLTSANIIASDAITTTSATPASLTSAGTTPVTFTPVALTSASAYSHTSSAGSTASLVMSSTGSTAPLVTSSTGSTGPLVTSSTGSTGPLVTSSTGSTSPLVTSSAAAAAAKIASSTPAAVTPSTTTPESETHYVPVTHFLPELQVKDGLETDNNGNSSGGGNGGGIGNSTPPGVDSMLEDGISAVANMLQNTQKPTVVDRPVPMEYQEIGGGGGGGYGPYDKLVSGDGKPQPQWSSSTERRPQVTVKSDTTETTVTSASDTITLRELYETTTARDLDTTMTVTEPVTVIADEISRNSEMLTVFNVSSSSAMAQEAKLADSSSSAETYLDSTTPPPSSSSFDRAVMTTTAVDPLSTEEPTTYAPPAATSASPVTLTPATVEARNSTAVTPTAIDVTATATTSSTTSSTTTTAAYNSALKSPGPSSNAYRPPASPSAVELHPAPHESMGLEASVAFLGDDVRRFADLCNELSFKMWTAVTGKGQIASRSLVLSPFELTAMLAMVFLGARGSTSGQMNDVLRLDDMVTFNPHQVLRNVTHSITNANNPGVATASFVREIYSHKGNGKILDFYKERVQQYYDGHVEEVDFNAIGDVLRRRTNLLVKRQTLGRVVEYLRGSGLSLTPPFAAFSANVFQTSCESASTEGRDGEMYFVVRPSTRQRRLVPVPAAVWRSGFLAGYEPGLDATAVCLSPDSAVSTILVLPGQQGQVAPGDGLARLEQRLIETSYRRGGWSRVLRSLLPRPGLELQVPRFSHRSVLNATAALQKMGLKDVFNDQKADLRGVNGLYDLYLSDMLQVNTFSTCGEDVIGARHHVETYPASPQRMGRVEMLAERRRRKRQVAAVDDLPLYSPYSHLPLNLRPRQARLPDVPRLRFDRPFLYLVRHNPTGMIIYLGRFNPRLLP